MGTKTLTKTQRKKLISLCLGLAIIGATYVAQQQGWIEPAKQTAVELQPGQYQVVRFEDGDTITVDMNGTHERVRFIGVDTPETQDPRYPVQCFGRAASTFTKNFIGASPVRLEADPLNTNRDRYNRLLRYVYTADGRLVNAEIIKQGYGFAYLSFPFTKSDEFASYQAAARAENRGLWNECDPTTTEYGSYRSNNE